MGYSYNITTSKNVLVLATVQGTTETHQSSWNHHEYADSHENGGSSHQQSSEQSSSSSISSDSTVETAEIFPDFAHRDQDGIYCAICQRRFVTRVMFEDHTMNGLHLWAERKYYRQRYNNMRREREHHCNNSRTLSNTIQRAIFPGASANNDVDRSALCTECGTRERDYLLPAVRCPHCSHSPSWHHVRYCPRLAQHTTTAVPRADDAATRSDNGEGVTLDPQTLGPAKPAQVITNDGSDDDVEENYHWDDDATVARCVLREELFNYLTTLKRHAFGARHTYKTQRYRQTHGELFSRELLIRHIVDDDPQTNDDWTATDDGRDQDDSGTIMAMCTL